jgi:mono/diheme cytochrome c family protein
MNRILSYIGLILIGTIILSCKAKDDYQGLEYAPNMYHAVPYEPLSQITDEDAGNWVNSDSDIYGEYFTSNPNNPHMMNMRMPPPYAVARTKTGFLPYRVPKDSIEFASKYIKNPLDSTAEILAEGKAFYEIFCISCHGATGQGDGLVGQVMLGVPAYNVGRVKDLSEGWIFHTISKGRGRMYPLGAQIPIENRWKIVRYVQTLQNQSN